MDKSIRILTTALLVLLMTGSAMGAVDVTLERYDKNGDGVIDADERIMLDIDIQNARIRVSESMFVGGYTTTGSLLLNDEFQDFAFAGRQIDRHTAVADPEPIVEPKVIVTQPPPPTQTPVPPPTSEDCHGCVSRRVPVLPAETRPRSFDRREISAEALPPAFLFSRNVYNVTAKKHRICETPILKSLL